MKRSNQSSTSNVLEQNVSKKKVKVSRQDKKQLIKDELTSKKVEKKLVIRAHNDKLTIKQPANICITLGKMAYDLARSGTADHLADLTASLTFLIPRHSTPSQSSATIESCVQQALLFAETAYLLALSGISLRKSLHTTSPSCADATSVMDLLVHHAAMALVAAPPSASPTKAAMLAASKDIIRMLEYFAIAGLGLHCEPSYYHFSRLALAITRALSLPPPSSASAVSCGLEPLLLQFLTRHNAVAGSSEATTAQDFSPQAYWLHSPCGGPLTALWLHSAKQKKVRVGAPSSADSTAPPAPGTRLAKLSGTGTGAAVSSAGATVVREQFLWGGDSPVEFADTSRPLVVDVGCGFGVSLLGLAAVEHGGGSSGGRSGTKYNYLGCDLSSHCIAYASGMARQWDIQGSCRFCVAPAEDFLGWVLGSYPGPVVWINVQFPTPYKFESRSAAGMLAAASSKKWTLAAKGGDDDDDAACDDAGGFMVTRRLMDLCVEISLRKGLTSNGGGSSRRCSVYVQSNVEDVAVTLRARFEDALKRQDVLVAVAGNERSAGQEGKKNEKKKKKSDNKGQERATASYLHAFSAAKSGNTGRTYYPHDVFNEDSSVEVGGDDQSLGGGGLEGIDEEEGEGGENVPRRQQQWIADGGQRADTTGGVFLTASPLPLFGHTETEVAYHAMRKPVHRVGWLVQS